MTSCSYTDQNNRTLNEGINVPLSNTLPQLFTKLSLQRASERTEFQTFSLHRSDVSLILEKNYTTQYTLLFFPKPLYCIFSRSMRKRDCPKEPLYIFYTICENDTQTEFSLCISVSSYCKCLSG